MIITAADRQLASFFGGHKVSLEIDGFDNPVDYLVQEGYLAEAQFSPLLYSGTYEPSDEDIKRIGEVLDIPARILEALAEDDHRNLAIVRRVEELLICHSRIIVKDRVHTVI